QQKLGKTLPAARELINSSHQLLNLRGQQRQDAGRDQQSESDAAVKLDQLHGVVGHKKGGKVTRQFVAECSGQEPNAHHYAKQLHGRELRDSAQSDWTQAHLTDHFEKVETYQPEWTDTSLSGHPRSRHQQGIR